MDSPSEDKQKMSWAEDESSDEETPDEVRILPRYSIGIYNNT
jgi:hypothetical protein